MEMGEYQAAYWPSEWEPLKNIGSIIAFGLLSGEGCNPCGRNFQFLIFFFFIKEPLEEKYESFSLNIESAGML